MRQGRDPPHSIRRFSGEPDSRSGSIRTYIARQPWCARRYLMLISEFELFLSVNDYNPTRFLTGAIFKQGVRRPTIGSRIRRSAPLGARPVPAAVAVCVRLWIEWHPFLTVWSALSNHARFTSIMKAGKP